MVKTYKQKKADLLKEFVKKKEEGTVLFNKKSSNLFRVRRKVKKGKINVKHFNQVISIDTLAQTVDVEGMTTYEDFVVILLNKGFVPTVAPELKSITVGGAISGIGVESSSFKYGFVHETVLDMDVLIGRGDIVTCSPRQNSDLFYAIPNSYGTLGYVLRAKLMLAPSKKFVELTRQKFTDYGEYIEAIRKQSLEARINKTHDYVDGLVFNKNKMYLTLGKFVDNPPFVSDYTKMNIFYKSMDKEQDFMKTENYIFRYDTDWFWAAKSMGLENPILRRVFHTLGLLRSDIYKIFLEWDNKYNLSAKLHALQGKKFEHLIQDAEIPIEQAAEFLSWFHENITDRRPLTIGAVIPYSQEAHFTLFPMDPNQVYMNIGYYAAVETNNTKDPNHFNRLFDEKILELNAKKMMYSNSTFSKEEFWKIYDRQAYEQLKQKYDPNNVFLDLYDECVNKR